MSYIDFSVVLNALGKLIGVAIATAVIYLVPKVKAWIEDRLGKSESEKLFEFIRIIVEAAEQLYHDVDTDGTIRKSFVKDHLTKRGIVYTDEINAFVEGLVYELNRDKSVLDGLIVEELADDPAESNEP